jgi:hypothetical protein
MSRIDRRTLARWLPALIVLAAIAWPAAGWARARTPACRVDQAVIAALKHWAAQLAASTPQNPAPIVGTYETRAVLVPTCANGPLVGRDRIKGYFTEFLKKAPRAAFDFAGAKIGGDCNFAFASGLYTFTLNDKSTLPARFTYVLAHDKVHRTWLIAQHHSSLQPASGAACPH